MDKIDILSYFFILISFGIFYWFARFTRSLIKQHYDLYPLMYDVEQAEKKKKR